MLSGRTYLHRQARLPEDGARRGRARVVYLTYRSRVYYGLTTMYGLENELQAAVLQSHAL